MADIRLTIEEQAPIVLSATESGSVLDMRLSEPFIGGMWPAYEGSYTVVPGATAQVLSTERKSMLHDVTVAPIPSNYGLITWDGSVITVS